MADRPLHLAVVIPPFQRGSGGHNTIFTLLARLEEMGHTCSVWLYDPRRRHYEADSVLRRRINQEFAPLRAPLHKGFAGWSGADVVLATGWDTVLPGPSAARLPRPGLPRARPRAGVLRHLGRVALGRAHLRAGPVRDRREPLVALDLLAERYGMAGSWFRLGVDHGIYRPRPVQRRSDTVIFYAREFTPRRAVALGALALTELHRRRPQTRFVLFGQAEELHLPFDYEQLGVTGPEVLSCATRRPPLDCACRSPTTR